MSTLAHLKDWLREEDVDEQIPDVPNGPLFKAWAAARDAQQIHEQQVHRDLIKAIVGPDGRTGPAKDALCDVVRSRMNGHAVTLNDLTDWVAGLLQERGQPANRASIKTIICRESTLLVRAGKGQYRRVHQPTSS